MSQTTGALRLKVHVKSTCSALTAGTHVAHVQRRLKPLCHRRTSGAPLTPIPEAPDSTVSTQSQPSPTHTFSIHIPQQHGRPLHRHKQTTPPCTKPNRLRAQTQLHNRPCQPRPENSTLPTHSHLKISDLELLTT